MLSRRDLLRLLSVTPRRCRCCQREVLHEAYVAVDEKRTEPAAATAVAIREASGQPDSRVLTVDRPFLYVIHDVEHGTPLFVGRVVDPS